MPIPHSLVWEAIIFDTPDVIWHEQDVYASLTFPASKSDILSYDSTDTLGYEVDEKFFKTPTLHIFASRHVIQPPLLGLFLRDDAPCLR